MIVVIVKAIFDNNAVSQYPHLFLANRGFKHCMKKWELLSLLSFYGYDLIDLTAQAGYDTNKSEIFGIQDRRDGKVVSKYQNMQQLEKWVKNTLVTKNKSLN